MSRLQVGPLTVGRGEKVTGYLPVPGVENEMPVILVGGSRPGKTVLVTGGIHNAEYVGIEAAIRLGKELEPHNIRGNVIVVPLVNRSGFSHRTMSMVYEDGKNLNREFPGNPEGTAAEKICDAVVKELHKKADYYIDLHCGDGYEELIPYTYYAAAAPGETGAVSRQMACRVDSGYIVASGLLTGGSYNYAAGCGIPSILIERGCVGRWSEAEAEADQKDVKNILRFLGVLDDGGQVIEYFPREIANVHYINAAETGCWYPRFHAGDRFRKGAVLGVVKDFFGQEMETCTALCDGIVLYQTVSLNVLKDGPMIAYGEYSAHQ